LITFFFFFRAKDKVLYAPPKNRNSDKKGLRFLLFCDMIKSNIVCKEAQYVNLKWRYIRKQLIFRLLPYFGVVSVIAAALIWAVGAYGSFPELVFVIIASAIILSCILAHFIFNTFNFLDMIKKQEIKYRTKFNDKNHKTVSKFGLWIICSESWLISPGKFAIHRQEIKSISLGEGYLQYKQGIIYPVRIKTCSGKTLKLKFNNENHAKAVRNWARR
jgi:hypothetical protein